LSGSAARAGRCRLGGPALLDPGTAWPQASGFPLSLHAILNAVLDVGALVGWLGNALPTLCPGLLNFFADRNVPYEACQWLDLSQLEASRQYLPNSVRASPVEFR
jgi:hypothetical protein